MVIKVDMDSYIMGLLATDGSTRVYNRKRDNGISYFSKIELSDKQLIEDLADYLNLELNYRKRVIANKEREYWSVGIPSKLIKDDGKYLVKGRPDIKKWYDMCEDKNSFIRGMFDGDGCVSHHPYNNKFLRIGVSLNSNSPDLLDIWDEYCHQNNITLSKYYDKRGSGSWYISINSKEDVFKLYTLIYKNRPNLYLKRKYDIFIKNGYPLMETLM